MPKILVDADIDPIADEVEQAIMTATEEAEAEAAVATLPRGEMAGDLSDGGRVGGVTLTPMRNGRKVAEGRAAARRAWMYNGTESLLPLAWNPDGTMHDGARRYLLKRHCLCCKIGGFRGAQCPNCVKSGCGICNVSTKPKVVIPCFYLRKDDVPFPERFYGSIECFLTDCARRGEQGFQTEPDMRMHAMTRHKLQYQAYQAAQEASKTDEIGELKARLDAMMLAQMQVTAAPTPVPEIVLEPEGVEEEMPGSVVESRHLHRYNTGRRGSPCQIEGCTVKRTRTATRRRSKVA